LNDASQAKRPAGAAARWFAGLATGTKMLIILGLALLPLGLIAILASLNAAQTSRASEEVEARAVVALAARQLSWRADQAGVIVRLAAGARDPVADGCERATQQLASQGLAPVRLALFAPGNNPACATPGYTPPSLPAAPPEGALSLARLDPAGRSLTLALYAFDRQLIGAIELPQSLLAALVRPEDPPFPLAIDLAGETGSLTLFDELEDEEVARQAAAATDLLGGRYELRLRAAGKSLSAGEVIMILLPVLMWLLAAIIGWLIVDRLLLRPLTAMQRAISAYRPGETDFQPPAARSPAREISDLGDAFDDVTRTVARHEAELEAAVERQTRLVREVHHRVKNNLQVVASLLNIHSRGSRSDEVAAAYASIQRRVDALAVVHRNHYAELEKTPGVALRALISELGASLRASAPSGSSSMQIRLALEPLYSNQDVAVSVAFLITETVEFAMLCDCSLVSIALENDDAPNRARLTIESQALNGSASCPAEVRERFERIITGLARQLRSKPLRDTEAGSFSVTIAVLDQEQP